MSSTHLAEKILRHYGIEYALTDSTRRLLEFSPGLMRYARRISGPLMGQPLERLFDLFVGMESDLEALCAGQRGALSLEKIEQILPNGERAYFSLDLLPHAGGILAVFRDVSAEARLEQRITQQRNELNLLSGQLARSRAELDHLLHRFVPARVADQIVSRPASVRLGGEKRLISALFADMRGFTSLAEFLTPEDLLGLLNQNFQLFGRVITQAGGEITNYAGDMLMAVFNAHQDQPDHALRAVLTGLEIQAIVSDLRKAPRAGMPFVLDFGIGINSGAAVVGYLGYENRLEYTAIGEEINIASRLSGLAKGGQILLTRSVWQQLDGAVATRELGLQTLRGKSEPLLVYETLSPEVEP